MEAPPALPSPATKLRRAALPETSTAWWARGLPTVTAAPRVAPARKCECVRSSRQRPAPVLRARTWCDHAAATRRRAVVAAVVAMQRALAAGPGPAARAKAPPTRCATRTSPVARCALAARLTARLLAAAAVVAAAILSTARPALGRRGAPALPHVVAARKCARDRCGSPPRSAARRARSLSRATATPQTAAAVAAGLPPWTVSCHRGPPGARVLWTAAAACR